MNCKNCSHPLTLEDDFCSHCGAKVIKNRITFIFIFQQLLESLGWDNAFMLTIKQLYIRPHIILKEYINGTRKKYLNPFSFLLIAATITYTTFNFFKDDYDKMMKSLPGVKEQMELASKDLSKIKDISEKELKNLQIRQKTAKGTLLYNKLIFKYFTLATLLFIPLYSFLSKATFKKPYNYGEHIIINTYLNGAYLLFSTFFFFVAKFTSPIIFNYSFFILMLYYCYSLSKLHQLSFFKSFLKLLRFLVILSGIFIVIFIMGTLIGLFFT